MVEFTEMDKLAGSDLNRQYLEGINKEQQRILGNIPPDIRPDRERTITGTFQSLSNKLAAREDFEFGERQQAILKLKITRHLEKEDNIDASTLFDAIIESPGFINKDRGSLQRLFEVHEEKTLLKIAEIRKKLAERQKGEGANPWENLFTTESGNYYVARLLNMPHLQMESAYMDHCVGTSDSYVNRMKKGEIEILSFRNVPKINSRTQKLEGDTPIITIEYNLKTNTIEQMKKANDEYLKPDDPYFNDVIDALKQLRGTRTDTGKLRFFAKINPSELENIKVADYHVLTENGAISFREFDPDIDGFVFKTGKMEIKPEYSRVDVSKIVSILTGVKYEPEELARTQSEVTNKTRFYIGELYKGIETALPLNVEIHPGFPEGKRMIRNDTIVENKNVYDLRTILKKKEVYITDYAGQILENAKLGNSGEYRTIILSVGHLMRKTDTKGYLTTGEVKGRLTELGLLDKDNPTPPEIAAYYALQNGDTIDMYEWVYEIGMEPVADSDGRPSVFDVDRDERGVRLYDRCINSGDEWYSDYGLLVSVRK